MFRLVQTRAMIVVGAPTCLPLLALGPLAEHFTMLTSR
jgi:K+-transporting ATPase A subunit